MAAQKEKVALIVNSASYDRVAFALGVATAAAALGKEVAVLFGYGAVVRLKKGCADEVGEETEAWIREQIKSGLEKGNVSPISESLGTLAKLGAKTYACPEAMALHNLVKDELMEGVDEVCSLVAFLGRDAKDATAVIYVQGGTEMQEVIARGQTEEGPVAASAYVFLSPEWVHEVTRVVQAARRMDENFRKLASRFSLSLTYLVTDIPQGLRECYGGSQSVVFVQLERGTVRKLWIGTELPAEKPDFTVATNYDVAKQIFLGQLNPATSFINRQLKVEPLSRVYQRPRFAAKSIVTGNAILKIARQVPTLFADGGQSPLFQQGAA